jgi:hypothetical protein
MSDTKEIRKIEQEIEEVPVWRRAHLQEVEGRIGEMDFLLRSAVDVANLGNHEIRDLDIGEPVDGIAVQERFDQITELLALYRQQNEDFIKALYEKREAGKAA